MAIDEKRKGEIAYLALKHRLKEDGIQLDANYRRRIGRAAKAIGVPFEELLEFSNALTAELFKEVSEKGPLSADEQADHHHGGH